MAPDPFPFESVVPDPRPSLVAHRLKCLLSSAEHLPDTDVNRFIKQLFLVQSPAKDRRSL